MSLQKVVICSIVGSFGGTVAAIFLICALVGVITVQASISEATIAALAGGGIALISLWISHYSSKHANQILLVQAHRCIGLSLGLAGGAAMFSAPNVWPVKMTGIDIGVGAKIFIALILAACALAICAYRLKERADLAAEAEHETTAARE